jgi:hypothetical protein
MALIAKSYWRLLHLLLRVCGLTGLLLVGSALALPFAEEETLYLLVIGGVLVALALIGEVRSALTLASSRRGSLGVNVLLQVVLAGLILVGVNVFSFAHYQRWDLTRDGIFSIDAPIRAELAKLQGDTTIVVHLRHVTFGQRAEKMDNYDAAAERKVVEKVRDLVEQFQDLGPKFKVVSLDVQEEGYQDKLTALLKGAKELKEPIERSQENSIFFYSGGKVQRLGFNDIYQLDKQSSQEANDKRGNLVLRYQGLKPFSRKIVNLDEKPPRVAAAVVHEILGLENAPDALANELGMAGARKVLEAHGFRVRDIILQKSDERGFLEGPAVYRRDESIYDRLEAELADLNELATAKEKENQELEEEQKFWTKASLDDLNKQFGIVVREDGLRLLAPRRLIEKIQKSGDTLTVERVDEDMRRSALRKLTTRRTITGLQLDQVKKEREATIAQMNKLNVEELSEQRRITDLKLKMNRLLVDCDLLIVPRMTLRDAAQNLFFPNRVHELDPGQLEAVKEFIQAGKPVLFCLGPINEPGKLSPFDPRGQDQLEEVLTKLGFTLPKQTVLFDVERKAYAERRGGVMFLGTTVEVPPVNFSFQADAGYPKALDLKIGHELNPILGSVALAARSAGKGEAVDFRLRNPRPVYFLPDKKNRQPYAPTFMLTGPDSWNSTQPFADRKEGPPRFTPTKPDDPSAGTENEIRRGPFPIGVAAELHRPVLVSPSIGTEPPAPNGTAKKPDKVRLAVIGHGGVFSGPGLKPIQEHLLLDVCNWLLGRDDLLSRGDQTWEYPRVQLDDKSKQLWEVGTRLGMPIFFIYLGCIVWMVRRMR